MEPTAKTSVQSVETDADPLKVCFLRDMKIHGPMIYSLAIRLTGNQADGQDLAQETFVKAFASYSQFRAESSAGTWFYRICVNVWKNRVRYEKRRSFWSHLSWGSPSDEEDRGIEVASPEAPLGSELEGMEDKEVVQQALARLTHEEKALIIMRDMDDKSYEEISKLLDVPLGTVKSRIARSRDKLRKILEPKLKGIL